MSSETLATEFPWGFIETTIQLTNFATADATIYSSDAVPEGFMGIIRDANIIVTTNGGGIYFRKRHKSGGSTRFTDAITTTATGISAVVTAGDKIEVAVSSAGAGVFDVVFHGILVRTRPAKELGLAQRPEQQTSVDGI